MINDPNPLCLGGCWEIRTAGSSIDLARFSIWDFATKAETTMFGSFFYTKCLENGSIFIDGFIFLGF